MTTLPTEIIFDAGLISPVLYLSSEILAVFHHTLSSLRDQIDDMGIEQAKQKL
ncbi:MAG: hypothetical protein KME31_02460 [Tolypothrix carrinoi HA7290-LM1]|jgi:hypothetical protein|nr:hypothetical protein [Tolypothrix carrinoi HA7290-LM1]